MGTSDWWARVDAADELGDDERRDETLWGIVEELEPLLANGCDPELHFIAGYAQYVRPVRKDSVGVQESCQRHLMNALRFDPDHHRARLYLGHLLFDRGELREARGWLDVPPGELAGVLEAKRRELLVVCALELDGGEQGFKAFEEFRQWCSGVSALEVLPRELVDALERVELSESQRAAVADFVRAIDQRASAEATDFGG